jgi:CheY-like chemotaxis protein
MSTAMRSVERQEWVAARRRSIRSYTRVKRSRVLVIDDEAFVVEALTYVLEEAFEVVATTDARAALRRLLDGERFDVILSDVTMAPLSGLDLRDRLHAVDPRAAARIVFMTGGVADPEARRRLAAMPNPCMSKPVSGDEVVALVRGLADLSSKSSGRR